MFVVLSVKYVQYSAPLSTCVGTLVAARKPLLLPLPRRDHALADLRAPLALGHRHQLVLVQAWHLDVDVDAVEQGAGDALQAGAAKLWVRCPGSIWGGWQEQPCTVSP
jgi:hypothetical protein